MKRLIPLATLVLVLAGCGSEEIGGPGTGSNLPEPTKQELLAEARALWNASRPQTYEFTYRLGCECDQGPWLVRVDSDETVFIDIQDESRAQAPYDSIGAIFDEIAATIIEGRFPVDVDYHAEYGYPVSYTFNGPELAVDGGFILTVTDFVANPPPGDAVQRAAFLAALSRWEESGIADYTYSFTRWCFCLEEAIGPYEVFVEDDTIVSATFNGVDVLNLKTLDIRTYDEVVRTVFGVFAEIERAVPGAAKIDAAYDPETGFPTRVSIDWSIDVADDEITYVIESLQPAPTYPDTCSTAAWYIDLVPQVALPEAVATTRQAIYQAAMSCDFDALLELAARSDRPFQTTFGGSGAELFGQQEGAGLPILQDVVQHLNLPFAVSEDGQGETYYVWPSAMNKMTSPYGDGIPADEYEALLTVYTEDELEEMFDTIGGYVGWRHGVTADGEWMFFIAGD